VCGLKSLLVIKKNRRNPVTPFTGVWIEINMHRIRGTTWRVTPFTGVWIEIGRAGRVHPGCTVTPFTGVWIEMILSQTPFPMLSGHTLHGCVD